MASLDKAEFRAVVRVAEASEIARMATRSRDLVAREEIEDQLGSGPIILDGLRRRPHYFDGRFLTGADLTRDQDYVRQRQADMARANSAGVISGLQVRSFALARGQTLRIEAGVGLTPSGDVVMLNQARDVPLLDLPINRQLDAAMGLREEPRVPLGRRTGLFILALRAVEFTANPIAAYPRTLTGRRTVEDGDIIEATAISLIPYPETSGASSLTEARRKVARQIFLGEPTGLPQDALPLALIAVERGTVRWIDTFMVRRETGQEAGVHVAHGGRPRALAEAHILQHRAHLGDVIDEILARGLPPLFAAAQYFAALPPAGPLPAAAVQPDAFGFEQFYFPPAIDTDLAFVPVDEIGVLVEESLTLPPIDLEAGQAELEATGVVILIPVTRARFQRLENALFSTTLALARDPAVAGGGQALDLLASLVLRRRKAIEAAARDVEAAAAAEAEALRIKGWHAAFQEAVTALPFENGQPPMLWYMRRRSIPSQSRIAGVGVAVSGDDVVTEAVANENIARLRLKGRITELIGVATPQATARMMALLGSGTIAGSDILTVSAVSDLERVARDELPPVAAIPVTGGSQPFGARPEVAERLNLARSDLAASRAGMARLAMAAALGRSTVARRDTDRGLSEGEVLDVAEDYEAPRVGEGFVRLDPVLGTDWPDAKGATWLGGSGKALAVDAALRIAPETKLAEFSEALRKAVDNQDAGAVDQLLEAMR